MLKDKVQNIALAIAVLSSLVVAENAIAKEQANLQRINSQIKIKKQKLSATQKKEKASWRTLYKINKQLRYTRGNLNYTRSKIYDQTLAIKKSQAELQAAEEQYDKLSDEFAKRLLELFKSQDLNYLSIILSNKSLSDLLSRGYFYNKLLESDVHDLQELHALQEDIKQQKQRIARQKSNLENYARVIQQKKKSYEQQASHQRALYASIKNQRIVYEQQLDELLRSSKEVEAMIARLIEEGGSSGRGTGSYSWPARGFITSPFGLRTHPILGSRKMHTGIDIAGPRATWGSPVRAADSGVVIFSGWWGGVRQMRHHRSRQQLQHTLWTHV